MSRGIRLIALAALLSIGAGAQTTYHWPLDLPKALTSSFGEYRPGRFHAGIDLRTSGVGRPVHAADNGHISRLRCSPWGYGKAAYVQLDDGNTVIYAHLSEFSEPLRKYVREHQHAQKSYTVDLYLKPTQFPIARGQVIARSGQTGIGAPHLHYEIRDTVQRPINPQLLGITWPDATAPVFRQILVMPGTPDSRVNGDVLPVVLDVKKDEKDLYVCDPISATGKIGFATEVVDLANGGTSKLGVWSLRTVADDNELFVVRSDCLSYDNLNDGVVAYHPFFLDEGRFLLQWLWPANTTLGFSFAKTEGWFEPAKYQQIQIEAEDFMGNVAKLSIPLAKAPIKTKSKTKAPSEPRVDIQALGHMLVITASFAEPENVPPLLVIEGDPAQDTADFFAVNPTTFRAAYACSTLARQVTVRVKHDRLPDFVRELAVFHRGDSARKVDLGQVQLQVQTASPYDAMFICALAPSSDLPKEIGKSFGAGYEIWPRETPIDDEIELFFPIPDEAKKTEKIGVYRATSRRWSHQSSKRIDDTLVVKTRQLGVFKVMQDKVVPTIEGVLPTQGRKSTTKRPTISATVDDRGSGVIKANATCDGKWLLMEYDPERKRLEWARDQDLPAGPHEIEFTVTDRAGNTKKLTRKIVVP